MYKLIILEKYQGEYGGKIFESDDRDRLLKNAKLNMGKLNKIHSGPMEFQIQHINTFGEAEVTSVFTKKKRGQAWIEIPTYHHLSFEPQPDQYFTLMAEGALIGIYVSFEAAVADGKKRFYFTKPAGFVIATYANRPCIHNKEACRFIESVYIWFDGVGWREHR